MCYDETVRSGKDEQDFKDRLSMGVTPVADTFIDTYMAAATENM